MGLDPTCSALPSSLSCFFSLVPILCSATFHPAPKEQMEEISSFSETQKSNLHLQRTNAHPTCTFELQPHTQQVNLQTFLPGWCYRNGSFSGCLGKADRVYCIYLAPLPSLQVVSVWLYPEKEKQHGKVGNVSLPVTSSAALPCSGCSVHSNLV